MSEAPLPIINNQRIIIFSGFSDKKNKINFNIINTDDYIEFFADISDSIFKKNFYLKESESNLMKNSFLLTGGNISGIFKILEFYYLTKKAFRIIEFNDSIKLIFDIEHPLIKNVEFILLESKMNQNSDLFKLSNYVYNIQATEIKYLKERNNINEKSISSLNNEIKDLKNIINDLRNKISYIENKYESQNQLYPKYPINENIFNSKINFDVNLIKCWLNNRRFKATLLFRMSEDGDSYYAFHSKCDNKGITITFIETTTGMKFGGYTELNWDCSNKRKNDDSTFLFCFNYKEKYTKSKDNYSIDCITNDGPKFGWGPQIEFGFAQRGLKRGRSIKSDGNTFTLNGTYFIKEQNINNNNKEYVFDTKELEIFKIDYY